MTIGIIGCGTMGAGIAQVAATYGNKVVVVDTNEMALIQASQRMTNTIEKLIAKGKMTEEAGNALLQQITWTHQQDALAESNMVIEAIVENVSIKQALFSSIETIVNDTCILASNTSSLSITSIASACKNPTRVIGIHFFNPDALMELVEIIPALQTISETTERVKSIIDRWKNKKAWAKQPHEFCMD